MINRFKKQAGFTVLESIVAILVLSLSISGVFSSVQQGLSQSIIAKDEVKAFYLAQEAIEIIRNKRDNNQILIMNTGNGNWLDGIGDQCSSGKFCQVEANPSGFPLITYCGASWGECSQYLKQDTNTFLYGYNTGDVTNFKRAVQVETINANEVAVTVRVSWDKGSTTRKFEVTTHLFNWM